MRKIPAKVMASDQQKEAAIKLGATTSAIQPYTICATYDRGQGKLIIHLSNEVVLSVPPQLLQGLEDATAEQLAAIQIIGPGTGLHWPALNVDHSVSGLLAGVFGTRQWMAKIGRRGGRSRSKAKMAAARRNGKRGGRPFRALASQSIRSHTRPQS